MMSERADLAPMLPCPWTDWTCPFASERCKHPQSQRCVIIGITEHIRRPPDDRAARRDAVPWSQLSRRETQVAEELLQGSAPSEIARALHISPHTARNHVKSMLRKLGVHSQTALVALLSRRA